MNDKELEAMKQGVDELRENVTYSEERELSFVTFRALSARAALRYVEHLESVGARHKDASTAAKLARIREEFALAVNWKGSIPFDIDSAMLNVEALLGGAAPAEEAEPVARLQEEISDRPYSKGEKYFEVIILDRERCADGMELFTRAAPAAQPDMPTVLELPDGDNRTARVVWHEVKDGKRHLCIVVEDAAPTASQPAPRPTDDHLWDETIRDRDTYHEWADKLAEAISKHFGAYIGEHSNTNCPWAEALEAIEDATTTSQPDEAREELLREAVSDFRKATYEFARGQDPDDHARMLDAQRRIFEAFRAPTAASPAQQQEQDQAEIDSLIYPPKAMLKREDWNPQTKKPHVMPPTRGTDSQHSDGWPGEIYLQAGDEPLGPFSEYDEVSWCDHPQGESDVRYVRADGEFDVVIDQMVNRFLGWPLPDGLCPGVERPIGTHLLNADQARAMLEYMLAGRFRAQGGEQAPAATGISPHPVQQQEQGDERIIYARQYSEFGPFLECDPDDEQAIKFVAQKGK